MNGDNPASSSRSGRVAAVLSIAGSDSGGGAGVQADLKAFARCGVHGMTALTAITAQNTVEVRDVVELPRHIIVGQVRTVADDLDIDAVKIGMLGSVAVIEAVAEALNWVGGAPVVLDPVMVAESGARLLAEDAVQALTELLFPRATVVTPNIDEAVALVGGSGEDMEVDSLAAAVLKLGPEIVVITGGHREDGADFFFDGSRREAIAGERCKTAAAHGSGCTHSSVLAAQLALGDSPLEAARAARALAGEAVRDGLTDLGHGAGPVDVLNAVCPKQAVA